MLRTELRPRARRRRRCRGRQDMKSPRIAPPTRLGAVAVELDALMCRNRPSAGADGEAQPATGDAFANVAASPVRCCYLSITAAFLRDRAAAPDPVAARSECAGRQLSLGFNAVPFFYPGPAGYDAVVLARAQEMARIGIGFFR